eukprot:TRINITY_DN1714_c0_g1_i1.p1 TRINITY_DN1714_c0_g1~~TRINITY_DN1714_c0_g1_i1.p1  ORF type:complete len:313 (+),score=45.65 TRINITY_DN1714_c0_g1_i1:51-989(+)
MARLKDFERARLVTLAVFGLQLHPFLSLAAYLHWGRVASKGDDPELSPNVAALHLVFVVLALLSFVLVTSPVYALVWRWPIPAAAAAQRRCLGIGVNLLLSDLPLFSVETHILWNVGVVSGLQGVSFVWTSFSFLFSAIRMWTRGMQMMVTQTRQFSASAAPPMHQHFERRLDGESFYHADPGSIRGPYADPGSTRGPYPDPGSIRGPYPDPGSIRGPYPDPGSIRGPYAEPGSTRGPYADPGSIRGPYPDPGSIRGPYAGESYRGAYPVSHLAASHETLRPPYGSSFAGITPPQNSFAGRALAHTPSRLAR